MFTDDLRTFRREWLRARTVSGALLPIRIEPVA